MNLRILIYLNPSNIDKFTHEFLLDSDSGFTFVTKAIDHLNKVAKFHYYLMVPTLNFKWNPPPNVTLIKYPYMNDALNSRYHFDTQFINNYFQYKHDIDLCWTNLPENVASFKALFNKRREEIPIFCYAHWVQNQASRLHFYEPSFRWRTIEGAMDCFAFGYQSEHMLDYMKEHIFKGVEIDYGKFKKINPRTDMVNLSGWELGSRIAFNHRVSSESYFYEMFDLIKDHLKLKLWVTNINNNQLVKKNFTGSNTSKNYGVEQLIHDNLICERIPDRNDYFKELKKVRFGVSYHIGYSMWSMSVLDLMSCNKVVLVPRKNAFVEMFGTEYKYYFNDPEDFVRQFNLLQNTSDDELTRWGTYNRERAEKLFTWDSLAIQLRDIFYSILSTRTSPKTASVLKVISEVGRISKKQLSTNPLTDYGTMITSRAWNKTRIELMRDYGIQDDIYSPITMFQPKGTQLTKPDNRDYVVQGNMF